MHARELALALEALSLACITALGSSGCYIGCHTPWRGRAAHELGVEMIAVGEGLDFTRWVAFGPTGEIVLAKYVITKDPDVSTLSREPNGRRLNAVVPSLERLVAVGEGGAIAVSDDAGDTWSSRPSGTTKDLWAVIEWRELKAWDDQSPPTHPARLIAAGDGVILTSLDGEAWRLVDPPQTGWGMLRAAVAVDSRVWLVGDAGVAWSSEHPFETWVAELLGTSDDLLGISHSHWGAGNGQYLIAATRKQLFLREPAETAWRAATPEIAGEILGLSGGFVLTSEGKVFAVLSAGVLDPVPIRVDFVPVAIHGDHDQVVVVGRGGAWAQIDYAPCKGRPLIDAGTCVVAPAIERDDWQPGEGPCEVVLDEREASRWRRAGLDEHASIASFAIHVLELISLGAPPQLVREVQVAMADEVRHAALSFGLAGRSSGPAQGPGRLPIRPGSLTRCGDMRAIALALFEQGCVGETIAACEADVEARTCRDPQVRAVLESIAQDERRHAALAWSTLRWLVERDHGLRQPLRGRLREFAGMNRAPIPTATMRELIVPLATRLLA